MYDSTNVADDPLDADLVAYYIDGVYATTAAKVRQRFPTAVLIPISAIGSAAGIVGDVEPGCMTIAQAVRWVQQRRAAGADPSLYVNETYGWWPARQAFWMAGLPEPHWWVADYDGRPLIPPGAVAKQYANPPLTHGHFDRSVAADYWPGVDEQAGDPTHTTKGGDDLTPQQDTWLQELHAAVSRLEEAAGTATPAGANPAPPDYLGWSRTITAELADLKQRVELIEQSPAIAAEHPAPPGP